MSNLVEQNFQKGFNHNISVNEWLPFTEKKREIEKRARDKANKKKFCTIKSVYTENSTPKKFHHLQQCITYLCAWHPLYTHTHTQLQNSRSLGSIYGVKTLSLSLFLSLPFSVRAFATDIRMYIVTGLYRGPMYATSWCVIPEMHFGRELPLPTIYMYIFAQLDLYIIYIYRVRNVERESIHKSERERERELDFTPVCGLHTDFASRL